MRNSARVTRNAGFESHDEGPGMLSSSLRVLLPRTQPIALVPCRYDSFRHFSRSCKRLQAELVDHLTPTNRIRNIAIIAHGKYPSKKIFGLTFFFNKKNQ